MANDFDAIADYLIEVIAHSDDEHRQHLAQMLEDYAEKYPRTWETLKQGKGNAGLSLLIDSMVEGSDARPGMVSQ